MDRFIDGQLACRMKLKGELMVDFETEQKVAVKRLKFFLEKVEGAKTALDAAAQMNLVRTEAARAYETLMQIFERQCQG